MANLTASELNKKTRPKIVEDWDYEPSRGWLDTDAFRTYCLKVNAAITSGCQTIGDIRRYLGTECRDRWLLDALNDLVSAGEITEVSEVPPRRYAPKEGFVPKKFTRRIWNGSHIEKSPVQPDQESLYGRR